MSKKTRLNWRDKNTWTNIGPWAEPNYQKDQKDNTTCPKLYTICGPATNFEFLLLFSYETHQSEIINANSSTIPSTTSAKRIFSGSKAILTMLKEKYLQAFLINKNKKLFLKKPSCFVRKHFQLFSKKHLEL